MGCLYLLYMRTGLPFSFQKFKCMTEVFNATDLMEVVDFINQT